MGRSLAAAPLCMRGPTISAYTPVLLLILSLCGFSGALATRLLDPLIASLLQEEGERPLHNAQRT
jgi:hypothetical protein